MAGNLSDKCTVTVSDDSMSATLYLEPPEDGIAYSAGELADFVRVKGVYAGLQYAELENMCQNNIYQVAHTIAKGTLPTEGRDGYYEVFFDAGARKSPLIRSDGSVDYQSMSDIPMVSVGERLMQYHAAVQGTHGTDVRGRALRAKPCKDLSPVKGSGFKYNDDNGMYTATSEGKVEFDGKTLKITDVYELKGDLDLVAGKIDFRGDVVVKGSVKAGTYIRATKTITIEGSVEAATLISGGDIILKKGMQGGKKARISCGGNVYANFIEFTQVEAKGNIEANIIMNCQVKAGKDIVISGRKGAIVGGNTYAVGVINSMFLGNVAGHKTMASVGISKELRSRENLLNFKLEGAKKSIENTNKEIIKVSDTRLSNDSKEVRAAKLSQLNRRLRRDEKLAVNIEKELAGIRETMACGKHAKISIAGTAFTGSSIMVDDIVLNVEREYKNSEFKKDDTDDRILISECKK